LRRQKKDSPGRNASRTREGGLGKIEAVATCRWREEYIRIGGRTPSKTQGQGSYGPVPGGKERTGGKRTGLRKGRESIEKIRMGKLRKDRLCSDSLRLAPERGGTVLCREGLCEERGGGGGLVVGSEKVESKGMSEVKSVIQGGKH